MNPVTFLTSALHAALTGFTQAAAGAAGILNGAKLKLFVNQVDPGKGAVIENFTLAIFTGSTPIAVAAWGEAYTDLAGNANILSSLAQWNWTGGTAETVYGVLLTDSADAPLAYSLLDTPKQMATTDDSLAIVWNFQYGDQGFGIPVRVA